MLVCGKLHLIMKTISLKKPSKVGLRYMLRSLYEFTGSQYYLLPYCQRSTDSFNLILEFWHFKRELKNAKNNIGVCRFSLIDGNGKELPSIINYLEF